MIDATSVSEECRCLIPEGTVVSIHVTVEESRKFSSLKLNEREFQKEYVLPGMYDYSNLTEGVRYTVDERRNQIVSILYLPAAKDCEALIQRNKTRPANEWQGLIPLHSSREDVERLLGKPEAVFGSIVVYRRGVESAWIKYIDQGCGANKFAWNVPLDTIERIDVSPMTPVFISDLKFDLHYFERFVRVHPKLVYYMNLIEGILIETRPYGEREQVTSIIYEAAARDENLRCVKRGKRIA